MGWWCGGLGLAAGHPHPQQTAGDDHENGNQLRGRHKTVKNAATVGIAAQKFQKVAGDAVEEQIRPENLAVKFLATEKPHQQCEVEYLNQEFINLRGMQGNPQRRSHERIGKGHAPGQIGRFSVTAARGKAAQTANGMAQGKSGGENIHGLEDRHPMTQPINQSGGKGGYDPAGKNSSLLQKVQAEQSGRVVDVEIPLIKNQQQLGSNEGGKDANNPQGPGALGINAFTARKTNHGKQPDNQRQGNQHTVGGQAEMADLKESGKHARCL